MIRLHSPVTTITLTDDKDKWNYRWGSSSSSATKMYKTLIDHPVVDHAFKWIWKSSCQLKRKVFFLVTPQRSA
jgi:hypothetical protein